MVETFDATSGTNTPVFEADVLTTKVSTFMVDFTENLNVGNGPDGEVGMGAHSVDNPSNWVLTQNGTVVTGGVSAVAFAFNAATNRYEAVVTFDGDATKAGNQPLTDGTYVLTVSGSVQDVFGNALDGDLNGLAGGSFNRTFIINTGVSPGSPGGGGGGGGGGPVTVPLPGTPAPGTSDTPVSSSLLGTQDFPAVASDPNGHFVAAWIDDFGDVVAQRFDANGAAQGGQFMVNPTIFAYGQPPAVAMDGQGNFIVVWAGGGIADVQGVYGRAFDNKGAAISGEFLINQVTDNAQDMPSVAMDAAGNWVATWTSVGQDSDQDGVFARHGNLQGALGNEFLVNTAVVQRQDHSDVAMDANGDFVVVWQSFSQDGSDWGVFGKKFFANGTISAEFPVNKFTNDKQVDPKVAMDANGDFVVAWSSFGEDGSGYGVYTRRFNAATTPVDGNDVRVNTTTLNWQVTPDVGMDLKGDYIVTWAAFGQDTVSGVSNKDYGIFARVYNANGSDYILPGASQALGEFRVNASMLGDQLHPAITVNTLGEYAIFWAGPAGGSTGIYDAFGNPWPAPAEASTTLIVDSTFAGDFNGDGTSGRVVVEPDHRQRGRLDYEEWRLQQLGGTRRR